MTPLLPLPIPQATIRILFMQLGGQCEEGPGSGRVVQWKGWGIGRRVGQWEDGVALGPRDGRAEGVGWGSESRVGKWEEHEAVSGGWGSRRVKQLVML